MSKFCFTTFSLQNLTLAQAVALAQCKNLSGIELRGRGHISPDSSADEVRSARHMLEDAGLEVACITAYMRFAQVSEAAEREQVSDVARYAELCAKLGAKNIRAFMGPFPEEADPERVRACAVTGLNWAAEAIRGSGVRLLIETHDSVKNGALLKPFLEQSPDEIGALLDIIHPYDMGEHIDDTLALIGPRIHHVHIKDICATVPGGRVYCRIGEGVVPVADTVRAMNAFEFDGYYCLEWEKSAPETGGVSFDEQLESFITFMRLEDKR